jgi:hypothetical protein
MQHSSSPPRRALKGALALAAAAAASLAFAGVASANVFVITPDSGGSDHLTAAITSANTNAAASNTIVLSPGQYLPLHQPITIGSTTMAKSLTIVGDHSFQAPMGTGETNMEINGAQAAANNASQNFLVVNNNATLTLEGFNLDTVGSTPNFAGIQVNGQLRTWGVTSAGDPGDAVVVGGPGTATLNGFTVFSNLSTNPAIINNGTLTVNNSDIVSSSGPAVQNNAPGTYSLNNTVIAGNAHPSCVGGAASGGATDGSIADPQSATVQDNSCGVQHSNNTAVDGFIPTFDDGNGGPDTTLDFTAASPTHTLGGVNCPVTDGRFFSNPVSGSARSCDIGAVTDGATRQTTGPTCQITNTAADHSTQTVTVQDALTGVGPQPGPATDDPSNTLATAYPPPAAVPVAGYALANVQDDNGTVAITNPFAAPSNSGLSVVATKGTAGTLTHWSFTALNWGGVSTNCF